MDIVVRTQNEMDAIPLDCKDRIIIRSSEKIIVKNKYIRPVEAWDNSYVEAWDNSYVEAWGNSSVVAWGHSYVEAWGNSYVEARGHSYVEAGRCSYVEARGHSSIVAWDNSFVVARDNSFVKACENAQIVQTENQRIDIHGNSRIVHIPNDIESYCDFYGIKTNNGIGLFYKAVHKKPNGFYCSDYDRNFIYEIGEVVAPDCFDSRKEVGCSNGIHVAHADYALRHGKSWDDLAILEMEVNLEDVVVPFNCDGKVRCSQAKVLREVSLNELGIYGEFLEKRRVNDGKCKT